MGRNNSQRGGYGGYHGGGRGWGTKGARGKGNAGYGGQGWNGRWQQPQHCQQAPLAPINITGASLGPGMSPAQPAQMQPMALASLPAPLQSTLVPQTQDPSQEGLAQLSLAVQQGLGQGVISLVMSDQNVLMLLQQGMNQAASQAQDAQHAQADHFADTLDGRFGLPTPMQEPGSQSRSLAKAPSEGPPMVVEQLPTFKGKAPKDRTPVRQGKAPEARDESSRDSESGKNSKQRSSSKQKLYEEEDERDEEGDEDIEDCDDPSLNDIDTDSDVASKNTTEIEELQAVIEKLRAETWLLVSNSTKSKKARAKAQAKLRASLATIAELKAENKAYKDQAASSYAFERFLVSRASQGQRIQEDCLSEDNVVANSTRSRTRDGQPDRGTPLKDILAEAKAQIVAGPEAYAAHQVAAKEQQRAQTGQAGQAPRAGGNKPPKGVLNKYKRKGKNKGTDTSPLRSVTQEGDSRKKYKETPPSEQPPPNTSATQADARSVDREFEEDEDDLEGVHTHTALMQDPIAGSPGASIFDPLGPAQSEEARPSSATYDFTPTPLQPTRIPRGRLGENTEKLCLFFLGERDLSPALGHLRLTNTDKLNCMLLGITKCLRMCSDLTVKLKDLPISEQRILESEASQEFLQDSYLKVSQEERDTFQTSLMEGVGSQYGIKSTRRMTLQHWLCIVMRVLEVNEVDIRECDYLMVARDPNYMVPVGCPLYNKLMLKVVPMRARLTGKL